MRVLSICGGTTDHVNPAVTLTQMFRTHNSGCGMPLVGADDGMGARLVPKERYSIEMVTIISFRQSLSPAPIGRDVRTLLNMNKPRKQANAILDHFQPDLVVDTDGYISFPVMKAATKWGILTAIHESNVAPGLTTKTLSKVVGMVMVGPEESRSHCGDPGKVVVTDTPARTGFSCYTQKETRAELGLADGRPLVPSVRGGLGAEVVNCQMAECIALEYRSGAPFHHIHGAGRGCRVVLDALQGSGLADHPEVDVREYIYDIPLVMAAADLALYRTGVSTIAEIAATAKPAVLVSSPNVVTNHQTKSARMLANADGAVLLPEGESSEERLYALVTGLFSDAPRREAMSRILRDMAVPDAAEQIYWVLVRSMEKRAN